MFPSQVLTLHSRPAQAGSFLSLELKCSDTEILNLPCPLTDLRAVYVSTRRSRAFTRSSYLPINQSLELGNSHSSLLSSYFFLTHVYKMSAPSPQLTIQLTSRGG